MTAGEALGLEAGPFHTADDRDHQRIGHCRDRRARIPEIGDQASLASGTNGIR